jgi:two-component system, OmpR family, response regulator ChvI
MNQLDDRDSLTYTIERLHALLRDRPPSLPVVLAIISAIVEAAKGPEEDIRHCGRLTLKLSAGRALWDTIDVKLTAGEFNVVRLLASNAGNHVTYRAVYDCTHVVGFISGRGEHGYRMNVRSMIKRIRNKFRLIDPDFHQIENFTAFGYRWVG